MHFRKVLGEAWGKAATVQNALSSFCATGTMPFNFHIIPDHVFLMQDGELADAHKLDEDLSVDERDYSPQPGPSGLQKLQKKLLRNKFLHLN